MKLIVKSLGCVSEETLARNSALSPDLPDPTGSGHLAVVGGGPSVKAHVERLRQWEGDVWAINGAFHWCLENGIDAAFMTIDPLPTVAELSKGARKAVIAEHCDPGVFASIIDGTKARGPFIGPTSSCAAAMIAIQAGYSRVTFFGCESSYDGATTHIYMDDDVPELVKVSVGGKEYLTELEYFAQAEVLSSIIRQCPAVYDEGSGGLLRALIADPECDLIAVSKHVLSRIEQVAA